MNAHPQTYNLDLNIMQFLVPEAVSIPKSIHVYKVQEKVSGQNSLWSLSNLVQKCLSDVVNNCKFECVWTFLRSCFSISEHFMCLWM